KRSVCPRVYAPGFTAWGTSGLSPGLRAVLVPALLRTEMPYLPIHRARHAGAGGNISSAHGVLLQFAAHHHIRRGRRRRLAGHVVPGLEKTAQERPQEDEDQQGN